MKYKLLLFDLDGTLLKSDKSISEYTLAVLNGCRNKGLLIGVSTSRSEQNSIKFLSQLLPDILISSGGALGKRNDEYIYNAEFSMEETNHMIRTVQDICGADCDCIRFSDSYWYKFTKKGISKENAIMEICSACDITPDNIMAFGDDFADIGMLKLCGMGIAMGNAIQDVKNIADAIIGTNDNDGIADYLVKTFNLCHETQSLI